MPETEVSQNLVKKFEINDPDELVRAFAEGTPETNEEIEAAINDSKDLIVVDETTLAACEEAATRLQKLRTGREKYRKLVSDPFLTVHKKLKKLIDQKNNRLKAAEDRLRDKIQAYNQIQQEKAQAEIKRIEERYRKRVEFLQNKLGMIMDVLTNEWKLGNASIADSQVRMADKAILDNIVRTQVQPEMQRLSKEQEELRAIQQQQQQVTASIVLPNTPSPISQIPTSSLPKSRHERLLEAGFETEGNGIYHKNALSVGSIHIQEISEAQFLELLQEDGLSLPKSFGQSIDNYVLNEGPTDPTEMDTVLISRCLSDLNAIELTSQKLSSEIGKHAIPHILKTTNQLKGVLEGILDNIKGEWKQQQS